MSPDDHAPAHPAEHEDRFDALLAQATDPGRALLGNELADCAACRRLLEEHLELLAGLDRAGRVERDDLREAELMPSDSGRAEQALRDHLALSSTGVSLLSFRWIAAAALVILGLGWAFFLSRDGAGVAPPQDTWLGVRPELIAPKGDVEAFDEFSWRAELPDNGWFRVVVHNGEGDGALVAKSPRLKEPHWKPAPEVSSRWPARIRWRLEIYRGGGAGDLVDSASASASRSR